MAQEKPTDLLCPACATLLVSKKFLNQVIEKCYECGGMFFDAEEVLRAQERLDDSIVWPEHLAEPTWNLKVQSERKMICPKDGAALVAIHYGPSAVVVDICPECRGVWFDYGEFNKVAEDLKDATLDKTSLQYLKDVGHEVTELVTGKKGAAQEFEDVKKTWHLFSNRLAIDHPFLINFLEAMGKTFP